MRRSEFRRKCIQLASALLYNANFAGFASGTIYKGDPKGVCVPGLNCYSCPGAVAACPLGSLQNALSAMPNKLPLYILGILMLLGLTLGRLICGFLCPFGLIQELLHRIPGKKLKKGRWSRKLSWLKYAVLAVFVEVEGAVAVPAAQRGDDLLQRAAGAFVVAAHHVGDDGVFGLMVDGLEKRLEALSLLGGNGHHRRAEEARKGRAVGVDAAPLQFVHEVEGDDHGALQFHQLQREVEVALDVGCVDDVQNHVRRVLGDEVAGDVFLDGIGRKRIDAGQVDQSGLFALQVKARLLALHGDAGPVAHILVGAGEGVEQRGLAAVGVARQGDGDAHASTFLTWILRASSARSVSV